MKNHHKFSTLLVSSAFVLLAACGRDDVPPANSSGNAIQDNSTPPPVAQVPAAPEVTPPVNEPVLRVDETDLIPDEYTTNDGSLARLGIATLQPTEGNATSGMVAFIQPTAESESIRVVGKIVNIAPGTHGIHVHEIGNCTTPDASSAGEHFNPTDAQHAGHEAQVRHVGDLGNLTAGADNTATFDFYDDHMKLFGMNNIIGKAFIVHANEDDLTTQPSGNSGDRLACGVIENRQPVGVPG